MASGPRKSLLWGAHGLGWGLGVLVWLNGIDRLWNFAAGGLGLGDLGAGLFCLVGAGLIYRACQAIGWLLADGFV